MDKIIYLVRHGNTLSNNKKIYAGSSPEGLSREGIEQVELLGEKMRDIPVSTIYTSPIKRAVHTARILNNDVGGEIIIEPDLEEIRMGPWEGLSENDVAKRYPDEYRTWLEKPEELRVEGREGLHEVQKRALRALKRSLSEYQETSSILITHVSVMRTILLRIFNLPLDLYKMIHVPNTCTYKAIFRNGKVSANRIN